MKLSVITVCYNALEDLKKTVDSVLNQTFREFEYVVIDGNSSDGTKEFLASKEADFAENEIPFCWISEPDRGIYDAMNKGANMAKGEYVNYMNAGDSFYDAQSLSKFFSHITSSDSGVLYGDTMVTYRFGSGIAKAEDYKRDNPIMPFCHQSCFVKTALMRQFRFDESYRIIADHDLFYRMSEAGVSQLYIEEVVACYNGEYGMSANNPLMLRLEGLRVHHVQDKWYYPFSVLWVYFRYGWIAWFKRNMPQAWSDAWMKRKRRRFIAND